MTTFQLLGLVLVGTLLLINVSNMIRGRGRLRVAFAWTLVWLVGGVALINPKLTAVAARWLGIGRGADLVSYVGVLVMLVGFFITYLRLRQVERHVTLLTRRLAIQGAREPLESSERARELER